MDTITGRIVSYAQEGIASSGRAWFSVILDTADGGRTWRDLTHDTPLNAELSTLQRQGEPRTFMLTAKGRISGVVGGVGSDWTVGEPIRTPNDLRKAMKAAGLPYRVHDVYPTGDGLTGWAAISSTLKGGRGKRAYGSVRFYLLDDGLEMDWDLAYSAETLRAATVGARDAARREMLS